MQYNGYEKISCYQYYQRLMMKPSLSSSDSANSGNLAGSENINEFDFNGESAILMALSHLCLIGVSGEDSESFLQGQFSNDISQLQPGKMQIHAYCNPKGRALAIIHLARNFSASDNSFWLLVPEDIVQSFVNRLRMFVLRAKVEFSVDHEVTAFGFRGDVRALGTHIESHCYHPPSARHMILANSRLPEISWNEEAMTISSSDIWRLFDIRSGIPQIYADTVEKFIPQNINLDLIDGISFKKGCYPGQEIVARIRYLGKSKQRLICAKAVSEESIRPGTEIFTPDKPDQKAGLIVDSVKVNNNLYEFSAMVPAGCVNQGALQVISANGPTLERIPLPYDISE